MGEPVDIVAVVVAILVLLTGKEVALLIGPYAALAIVACAGAGLALSGAERKPFGEAAWYVTVRVLLAIALTVALAKGMEKAFGWVEARYSVIPIAFLIGWVRDWNVVRERTGDLILRFLGKKIDDGK